MPCGRPRSRGGKPGLPWVGYAAVALVALVAGPLVGHLLPPALVHRAIGGYLVYVAAAVVLLYGVWGVTPLLRRATGGQRRRGEPAMSAAPTRQREVHDRHRRG